MYRLPAHTDLNARQTYANPADRFRFQQEIERQGAVRDYEVKLRKKDGIVLDCLMSATVRCGPDCSILGYHGIIRGNPAQWVFENGGVFPSPIPLANKKTKVLAGKLRQHSRRLENVFVETLILLTEDRAREIVPSVVSAAASIADRMGFKG